jgi:hypothetical protein
VARNVFGLKSRFFLADGVGAINGSPRVQLHP